MAFFNSVAQVIVSMYVICLTVEVRSTNTDIKCEGYNAIELLTCSLFLSFIGPSWWGGHQDFPSNLIQLFLLFITRITCGFTGASFYVERIRFLIVRDSYLRFLCNTMTHDGSTSQRCVLITKVS